MLVSFNLLWAVTSKGQTLEERKITIEVGNVTLEKALLQVEKLSGFRIAYASEEVERYGRVSLYLATRSVSATLDALLKSTSLTYKLTDNTIMILRHGETPGDDGPPPAQADTSVTLRGRVVDETGVAMPGVSVRLQGTTRGSFTDANGQFTITGKPGQTVVFSSVGSIQQEQILSKNATLNIILKTDNRKLDDVVVVGYGTQRKANLTGAVSTVDIEKTLQSRPISDVARGLQGTVPGLTITTASGDLGRNPSIRLRGMAGSLNTGAAGAQPLILVDNVEIPSLQMVNPQDIESISVLKDAASTSIYGTRAAWGVVLITTKSGRKGQPASINYSNNFSWSQPTTMPTIAGAAEGAEAMFLGKMRVDPNTAYFTTLGMSFDREGIEKMRQWERDYGGKELGDSMVMGRDFEVRDGRLYFYRPWDVGKMYMKDWTLMQKHDLAVSGGGEKTNYHLGLGYLNQSGVLRFKTDKFDRYNATLSVNSSVNDWIDVRGKMMLSQSVFETPYSFSSARFGPWYYLYRWPKIYPYGTYQGKPFRSAITEVQQANMEQTKSTFSRVQVGTTLKPFKGFTVDVDYTYSGTNTHLRSPGGGTAGINFWAAPTQLNYFENYQSPTVDAITYQSWWNEWNNGRAYATYRFDVNEDHHFKAMAGMDVDLYRNWAHSSERRTLIDQNLAEISLATGDQYVSGDRGHWATNGYFARLNYDYKNKYLLEVNGRYDGSSKFPRAQLYDFFPSVSAGYVLTEETFMDFAKPVLSFLKLRGSYGSLGNQNVGPNRFISVMSSSNSGWLIGEANQLTFSTPQQVSKSLTWETVSTVDFGVDARFFNNAFGITFDWYKRTTSDMIGAGLTLPSSFGGNVPVMNFGEMRTKGWELALDYTHTFDNGLRINALATLSDFNEKITKLASATRIITNNYEGKTIGEIWGYQTDRLFQESDFTKNGDRWELKPDIPSQTILAGNSAWFYYTPGDVKYVDRNGDSTLSPGSNTVDDPGDQMVIGNSTPRYQYGIRLGAEWKGFDFSIFIQGVGKRELWPSGPLFIPGFGQDSWYDHHQDYWTPTNTDAFYPQPTFTGQSNNIQNFYRQSRYLLNMAYTRVKNISLGYTVPGNLAKRIHMKAARVYVSAENLLTFDNLSIPLDPEIDYTVEQTDASAFGRTYPYRKEISFGVQLTF
ncbi:SusC/RagA family TonB-linked outer membrane protein [Chitinophaga cymbidii]|uniref:SusC/RagA family TonB-linked outer membrane protein n=2 Tax=Chitinophaga cymbidii TaxID=1096750 RepID=A0A512RGY5_9BACT|nr:SusC/RagA family TonB-linked outer membrane protein [Chitinophaga cymbidii]